MNHRDKKGMVVDMTRWLCSALVCLGGVALTSSASAETLKLVCPAGEGKVFIDGVELATCPGEIDIQPGSFKVKVVFEDGVYESDVTLKPGKDSILIAKPAAKTNTETVKTPDKTPDTTGPDATNDPADTTTDASVGVDVDASLDAKQNKPPAKTVKAPRNRQDPQAYKLDPSQIRAPYRTIQEARWGGAGDVSGLKFGYAPRFGVSATNTGGVALAVSPIAATAQYLIDASSIAPALGRVKPFVEGAGELRLFIIDGAPVMVTPIIARGGIGYHLGRGAIPNVFLGFGLSPLGIGTAALFPSSHIEIGSGLNAIGNPLGFDVRAVISIDTFRESDAPNLADGALLFGFALATELQF